MVDVKKDLLRQVFAQVLFALGLGLVEIAINSISSPAAIGFGGIVFCVIGVNLSREARQ